ncbi:hypothetical protein FH972_027267 [Carpinus fangiana]|uniref:Uncharacterized protein n=1 Tax=Carpinus fangiana TaxID=176857 RepID=A0A5N6L8Y0_9ROSI|nr:hypothetical protein FH972_027267 [Carpinus fangiana]
MAMRKSEGVIQHKSGILGLPEEIACGVADGRQEDAGAAGSPELQGRSEVQGRGRQS